MGFPVEGGDRLREVIGEEKAADDCKGGQRGVIGTLSSDEVLESHSYQGIRQSCPSSAIKVMSMPLAAGTKHCTSIDILSVGRDLKKRYCARSWLNLTSLC